MIECSEDVNGSIGSDVLNSDVLGLEDITRGVHVLLNHTVMHVMWLWVVLCPGESLNLSFTHFEGSCGTTEASFFAALSNFVSPFKGFLYTCLWDGSLKTDFVNDSTDKNCWFTSMSSKVHESSNGN